MHARFSAPQLHAPVGARRQKDRRVVRVAARLPHGASVAMERLQVLLVVRRRAAVDEPVVGAHQVRALVLRRAVADAAVHLEKIPNQEDQFN